jgi:hypothetical protein
LQAAQDTALLTKRLHGFKIGKERELHHVEKAVRLHIFYSASPIHHDHRVDFPETQSTLSAAAVLAAFSWTKLPGIYWLGELFWKCSLWLSIASLIFWVSQRLLEQLPDSPDNAWDKEHLEHVLRLILRPCGAPKAKRDAKVDPREESLPTVKVTVHSWELDPWMIWVWQSPMMLMSYSWVCFIIGYGLYLLTPIIYGQEWTVQESVSPLL